MALPLEVRDLRVIGDRGRELLRIDQLQLAAGGSVAITGASGAGKSTLLFALAGLMPGCTGSVHWGPISLLAQGDAARSMFRRDRLALVFQDFLLFDELGAAGNAAIAAGFLPRVRRESLRSRAASLLAGFGIDGQDRRSVQSLSGGERQRVAVARALAVDPDILLADEPTASLDRDSAERLMDDLLAHADAAARTLIVVTHDERLQGRLAERWHLADGRLT